MEPDPMNMEGHREATPILADHLTPEELANQLGKSARTLARWRRLKEGPPVTYVGRNPHYRREAVRQWLAASEVA